MGVARISRRGEGGMSSPSRGYIINSWKLAFGIDWSQISLFHDGGARAPRWAAVAPSGATSGQGKTNLVAMSLTIGCC